MQPPTSTAPLSLAFSGNAKAVPSAALRTRLPVWGRRSVASTSFRPTRRLGRPSLRVGKQRASVDPLCLLVLTVHGFSAVQANDRDGEAQAWRRSVLAMRTLKSDMVS